MLPGGIDREAGEQDDRDREPRRNTRSHDRRRSGMLDLAGQQRVVGVWDKSGRLRGRRCGDVAASGRDVSRGLVSAGWVQRGGRFRDGGFHITMRLTVLKQTAKGPAGGDLLKKRGAWCEDLEDDSVQLLQEDLAAVPHQLERIKWFLWHGNTYRALEVLDMLVFDTEAATDAGAAYMKLHKAVCEMRGYIASNVGSIPNYGERYRAGERISTGFAESAINQIVSKRMVKKQQMRWTPRGAHLLLQIRTRVLDDTLAEDLHRWVPQLHPPNRLSGAASGRRIASPDLSRTPYSKAVQPVRAGRRHEEASRGRVAARGQTWEGR